MNRYKVVVKRFGYPNGKLLQESEEYFNNIHDADKFKDENTWTAPTEESHAFLYEFKPGWILL